MTRRKSFRRHATAENTPTKAQARQIEHLPIGSLSADARNPRRHDHGQVAAIADSIEAFGFNAPILIDSKNKIIAGHGRVEAAKLCGRTHVPAIRLNHLNEVQARAYMLADNKLAERSSWDEALLATHLKELSELVADFDIEATGFETPEVDILIQSLDPFKEADKLDTFATHRGPAVSKPGDVWTLGRHRILCGSAVDEQTLDLLLGDEKATSVFTDPPYNVPINGHVGGKGLVRHAEFMLASGEMSEHEFSAFLTKAFLAIARHTTGGALIYVCMDWRHLDEIGSARRQAGFDLLNICVWAKSNGGMGSLYRSQHEFVFVLRNCRGKHCNNVQLGRFGRNRTNLWHYAGANSFPRKGRNAGLAFHPTSKPIALVADAILDVTKREEIVLDPFLGAGTTILAAERTGRRGFGVEIDAVYIDTAIARWQAMTGKRAVHSTGKTFSEIQDQRRTAP